jgi:hypothetical protein
MEVAKWKEAIMKRLHTEWFQPCNIPEQASYEESKKVSGCQQFRGRKEG